MTGRSNAGLGFLVAGVTAVLALAVAQLPSGPGGLTGEVAARLGQSGVAHPVTAVLLNFRAYDTWLEVAVLVLAALGTLALHRSVDLVHVRPAAPPALVADPVLGWLLRLLVPALVLTAGYLLWLGTGAPGGAFQAGAVMASAGVVLWMGGRPLSGVLRGWLFRSALLAGCLAFLATAAATLATRGQLLDFPPRWASAVILLVETTVTVSIVATLAALFVGAQPEPRRAERTSPEPRVEP